MAQGRRATWRCANEGAMGLGRATQRGCVMRETALALFVTLAAWVEATHYLANTSARSEYLLNYYAPAVSVAAGQGFQNIDLSKATAVNEFLHLKRTALSAADLGDSLPTVKTTPFQKIHRTSMTLLGLWWRLFGVRWVALDALLAILFALSCLFAYGVLRLSAPWPVALALGVALIFSPGFHYVLPQFRDFSKAPFVLGIVFACVLVVRFPMGARSLSALALAAGLWLGLGLGFRQDLRVYLPLAALMILGFASGAFRTAWRGRLVACMLLLGGFLAGASPVLLDLRGATNSSHIVALAWASLSIACWDWAMRPMPLQTATMTCTSIPVLQAMRPNAMGGFLRRIGHPRTMPLARGC